MNQILMAAARGARIQVKDRLTTERIRHMLNYDPETGLFTWRVDAGRWGSIKAGTPVGTVFGNGYVYIGLDNDTHAAHRVAWQHFHGTPPPAYVDHINRVRTDNRIANLREADRYQNAQNTALKSANRTGYRGVVKVREKYLASITFYGRQINLGTFKTAEDASDFYEAVATKLLTHYEGKES